MSRLWVLLAAAALDWLLGDPAWMPHPIRLMGWTISRLENGLRRLFPRTPGGELLAGGVLVLTMVLLFGGGSLLLLAALYALSPAAGTAAEVWLSYQLLAARCLRDESIAVYRALTGRSLMDAQRAVGRIVGRDTQCLDRDGVIRAAVETVAENTSDGVIAPLFWLALGGLPLGMVYKAVNTMDSMVGYRNERYLFFGRAAARTDDAANYLPARLSALLMCLAAALLPGFRGGTHCGSGAGTGVSTSPPTPLRRRRPVPGRWGSSWPGMPAILGRWSESPPSGRWSGPSGRRTSRRPTD